MFLDHKGNKFPLSTVVGAFLVSFWMTGCAATPSPSPEPQPVVARPTPEEEERRKAEEARKAEYQKKKDTAERALQEGRLQEALDIYLKLLEEAKTYDSGLGESVRAVVRKMKAPPSIPEEARKHYIYGNTALKNAQKPRDIEVALNEYYIALKFAPWAPKYLWNLSLAHKLHEDYLKARDVLEIYTSVDRENLTARQIKDIEENIYRLEYLAREKERKTAEQEKERERERQAQRRILNQREQCLQKVKDEADGRAWNIFESYQSFDRWRESERARCRTQYSVD